MSKDKSIAEYDQLLNFEVGPTVNGKDLGPEIIGQPLYDLLREGGSYLNVGTGNRVKVIKIDKKNRTITFEACK